MQTIVTKQGNLVSWLLAEIKIQQNLVPISQLVIGPRHTSTIGPRCISLICCHQFSHFSATFLYIAQWWVPSHLHWFVTYLKWQSFALPNPGPDKSNDNTEWLADWLIYWRGLWCNDACVKMFCIKTEICLDMFRKRRGLGVSKCPSTVCQLWLPVCHTEHRLPCWEQHFYRLNIWTYYCFEDIFIVIASAWHNVNVIMSSCP